MTRIIATSVTAIAALTLVGGCTNSADQQILDKLDTMQQEIDDLKNSQNDGTSDTTDSTDGSGSSNSQSSTNTDDFDATITDLEQQAASAIETAGNVSVPSNLADRPQAYIDAKAPLEQIELQVDTVEDQIEAAVRSGAIDRQTYFMFDTRLDAIDDSLDQACDSLELRMGVDD
ncbi:hypothetical protein BLEM_0009 [Bifidobacterium lemurum]|uniref:Lipoprotein n=1 Tax=Bifidobacterium lemurum TaxID=1603886 RepID=A0A261FX24_9BIFI|nr:hypothetical protein [Bifidobacterium lemurum]OZG63306.1 hypothetical protein BLEM_0009 [Bifidobacterium lemurum]QOL34226.1 hypothetical protein BL8807_10990 [Bifidobacterium lemurum]